MEDFPKNQENEVGKNTGAEILAEMPTFEKRNTLEDRYTAKEFNATVYEGTPFERDYDFDDDLYTSKVKVANNYRVERPSVEKTAIRMVADEITKGASAENDIYNNQEKNVMKLDILHSLFEGESLEKQTSDALKNLSSNVNEILASTDLHEAKIDISNTGVFILYA